MTLHTAKGLEWPVVVITGLEEGLFPSARAVESSGGYDEERRLCYVGITRAKDVAILTWARARRRGGELRPALPSRFLEELPPEVVEERRTSFAVGGLGASRGWGRERSGTSWRTPGTARRDAGAGAVRAPHPAPDRDNFRTAADAMEDQDAPRFIKGERVRHRLFGSGAILGLSGAGKNLKVSVVFDDPEVGTRQLLVALAGLERDWESA